MIARRWRGRVRSADSDAYLAYMEETGVAELMATPGNLGVVVFRGRPKDDGVDVEVTSFWDRLESIRAFAGDDLEAARFYPEDDRYLIDRELRCSHEEVALFLPEPE
jgi:heme-degrading monooxygenase HmoA